MEATDQDQIYDQPTEDISHLDEGDFLDESALPDHILCMIAENLDHQFVLRKLCMASRYFYISMQLRYKSLCIKHGVINQDLSEEAKRIAEKEKTSKNFKIYKQKTIEEQLIDSKNYMSIFGKFISKGQLKINLKMLKLDPLNPDNIVVNRKVS